MESILEPERYFIKNGYHINQNPTIYTDSEEDALTYQIDVYKFAAAVFRKIKARSLLDIGCGYGSKLARFLARNGLEITGIDTEHSIDYCRKHHAFGRWIVDDIERPQHEWDREFDIILSADVVEHLFDPDNLIRYMRRCAHKDTCMVISTPERDLRRGPNSMGPPQNPAHRMEWNREEFAAYLSDRGLTILEHRILNLREGVRTCQTVLARFT